MVNIGIDLGGTNIAAGIVDRTGKIVAKASCPTLADRPAQAVAADMSALCLKLMAENGVAMSQIGSVGVGLPGVADCEAGMVPFCTNLGWHDVPLRALLQERINKPVYLENDANVAALAEASAGISRGASDSIFITLGTGVGGGVISGGRLLRGRYGKGAELGHFIYQPGGEPCSCGLNGCWERYASATALIRMAQQAVGKNEAHPIAKLAGGTARISARTVIDAAREGDPTAKDIFAQYCRHVAAGLITLCNIFDPQIVAIGGGVSGAGEFLLAPVREMVQPRVFCSRLGTPRIEKALLGNDAGIIGAAMLHPGA